MTRLAKQGSIFAALAGVALFACVQGEKTAQSVDSTARNLTLAPTESTAALKDVPAPATEAAKPAPEKKAPEPATTMGRAAPSRRATARSTSAGTGRDRAGGRGSGSGSDGGSDAVAARTSCGISR